MKTETQERFEEKLKEFETKVYRSHVKFSDAVGMIELAENLLLRYVQIRKSRDMWKGRYDKLKEASA